MKKKRFLRQFPSAVCGLLLIASLVVMATGCPGSNSSSPPPVSPTVEHVIVTAAGGISMASPGDSIQFSAVVSGKNNPGQGVNWSIPSTHAAGTTINSSGLLFVAEDETEMDITVRATSTVDPSHYGEANIVIMPNDPVVSTVSVSPSTTSVAKGNTAQFTATVTGLNLTDAERTVTWGVESATGAPLDTGTTIADGLLTVAATETAKTLIVKATSTEDDTKSGTATVTIPATFTPLGGAVFIQGTPQVGSTLRADTSNLLGEGTIIYTWERKDTAVGTGTVITDATASTYTLVQADLGKFIMVTVTRSGNTGEKTDTTLTAVTAAPSVTGGLDGTITVVNGINEENVDFINPGVPSMSRTNGSIIFTLFGAFQSYRWYVDGIELTEEKGGSLTLHGADYSVGTHRILVIVYRNSVPYSQEIQFTVN